MKTLTLNRKESTDGGTFGQISLPNINLYSGEQPWRENKSNISCIPLGKYVCSWTYSPRFKRFMYLLKGVEGRSGIRIHPANFMGDRELGYKSHLHGCIALGLKLGWIKGQKATLNSRLAVGNFEREMNYKPFILEIKEWNY